MGAFSVKLANLLEYAGVHSKDYYHTGTRVVYDPDDPLTYYLDETERAHYSGPFDAGGVPKYVVGGRSHYMPVLISFYALGHLELYRRSGTEDHHSTFVKMADWFVTRQNKSGAWLTSFPMKKFGLPSGSPSAMIQGLAISTLVRAFHVTGRQSYRECTERALSPFHLDVQKGGVSSIIGEHAFYEEYPAVPPHHVLNGFIYALWGLYDLVRLSDNHEAKSLYEAGLKTLIDWLPRFDMGYWSLYHVSEGLKNPATVHYHRLHISQLEVMHALSGNGLFNEYATRWAGYLQKRSNALRTLPSKVLWHLWYQPK